MLHLLLLISFLPLILAEQGHWNYLGGEKTWCNVSPFCCGPHQSPIRLYTTEPQTTTTPIQFINYDKTPKNATLINTGHTVTYQTSNDVIPQIVISGITGQYNFDSLHFHWGNISTRGSEHTIDDRRYPIEMHIVHYSSKFNSLKDAIDSGKRNAVAVIGVLFNISTVNPEPAFNLLTTALNLLINVVNVVIGIFGFNIQQPSPPIPEPASTPGIANIASNLKPVRFNGQTAAMTPFPLQSLLPSTKYFFNYFGSLTTPNCNVVVRWTVLVQEGLITEQQLNQFRSLYYTKEGKEPAEPMVDNFRTLQPKSEIVMLVQTN